MAGGDASFYPLTVQDLSQLGLLYIFVVNKLPEAKLISVKKNDVAVYTFNRILLGFTRDFVRTFSLYYTKYGVFNKKMENGMHNSEFIDLLSKYGMTFYWGAIDKKWWIIGQVEGGTAQNSRPVPAETFSAAQVAALTYIKKKYKLDQQDE